VPLTMLSIQLLLTESGWHTNCWLKSGANETLLLGNRWPSADWVLWECADLEMQVSGKSLRFYIDKGSERKREDTK